MEAKNLRSLYIYIDRAYDGEKDVWSVIKGYKKAQ